MPYIVGDVGANHAIVRIHELVVARLDRCAECRRPVVPRPETWTVADDIRMMLPELVERAGWPWQTSSPSNRVKAVCGVCAQRRAVHLSELGPAK
ncbi:hypothetical protein LZC95_34985 [Pendulispora brunnea]|uniref:Uncharacterized protein n=1 Tax=Pendulispora brunnea TaxID=2905690 RepID=A0ABZ2JYU2_9BACT